MGRNETTYRVTMVGELVSTISRTMKRMKMMRMTSLRKMMVNSMTS